MSATLSAHCKAQDGPLYIFWEEQISVENPPNEKILSEMWYQYEKNLEKPPFKLGQKVRYISPKADQTVQTITWISRGATSRGNQLVSVNGDRITASVFVDAAP